MRHFSEIKNREISSTQDYSPDSYRKEQERRAREHQNFADKLEDDTPMTSGSTSTDDINQFLSQFGISIGGNQAQDNEPDIVCSDDIIQDRTDRENDTRDQSKETELETNGKDSIDEPEIID